MRKASPDELMVIKIGSAALTNGGRGLESGGIQNWVSQIATLKKRGFKVILVSSGAVAEGMMRLGLKTRPTEIYKQQAVAAVGQARLIKTYDGYFEAFNIKTAQILLTHDDTTNQKRRANAKNTINELLSLGVVPIVNENDTVATAEIRFGDNDTLAGLVTELSKADRLIILTDQDGMFDKNPSVFSDAVLLSEVVADDESLDKMASDEGGTLGRGGMKSKLIAARLAANSGAFTIIANADTEDVLLKIADGMAIGTLLKPKK